MVQIRVLCAWTAWTFCLFLLASSSLNGMVCWRILSAASVHVMHEPWPPFRSFFSCAFENDAISNIDPHAPPHRYICAPAEAPGALEEADPCEWEGPAGWLPACVASRSNAAAAP